MDYPPISRLVSATFDELNLLNTANFPKISREAPRAVANEEGMGRPAEPITPNSAATGGTNRVGTIIDTLA